MFEEIMRARASALVLSKKGNVKSIIEFIVAFFPRCELVV